MYDIDSSAYQYVVKMLDRPLKSTYQFRTVSRFKIQIFASNQRGARNSYSILLF